MIFATISSPPEEAFRLKRMLRPTLTTDKKSTIIALKSIKMTYILLYKDLKAIYNAYIEKNTRSKKGKVKMWKE